MKKIIITLFVVGVFAIAFTACGGSTSIKSEKDSVAYSIGIDLGNYIKNLDSTLNVDIIADAIKDVLKGETKIQQEDAYDFLREYFQVRVPQRAKEAGEKFLSEVEQNNKNIQKTASGLLYEIILPGDPNVKATNDKDVVKVVYEGKLKEGRVFDSSIERGDTAQFALNRVIKGWTEGMKLVGKGGQIRLWIPAELAYGERGSQGGGIGANEPLVFDVTIVDVEPADEE